MIRFDKYIVTHSVDFKSDGVVTFNNAYIIPNNYDHSLKGFQTLVAEARKSFPDLLDEDVECRTVIQSGWCKRCPVIRFLLSSGPAPTVDGWTNCENCINDVITN